jgi:hypothetical protein
MLDLKTEPLEIAARILSAETIMEVRLSEGYTLHGYSILDRWALNSPEELKGIGSDGAFGFHD